MTQNEAVLELLRERGEHGITAMDALHAVGSFRLAARISDLRFEGHVITSEMIATPSGKHVALYRLEEPGEPVQVVMGL